MNPAQVLGSFTNKASSIILETSIFFAALTNSRQLAADNGHEEERTAANNWAFDPEPVRSGASRLIALQPWGYVFYRDGDNLAFPIGAQSNPRYYIQWRSGGGMMIQQPRPDGTDQFFYIGPSDIYQLTIDGWVRWQTCQLPAFKSQKDDAYNAFVQNSGSSHAPFYHAKYVEAEAFLNACAAMVRSGFR